MNAEIRWGPAVLFCPGDRPDRIIKAAGHADVVVIDLEDAVGHHRREIAREYTLAALADLDPDRTIVRVNAPGTADLERDLRALSGCGIHTCMLPKAETRGQLDELAEWNVIALCETALGVVAAREIATATNCAGLMWGSEDLAAELGGGPSRPDDRLSSIMTKARLDVLIAAKAAGVAAVDTVFTKFRDASGLHAEAFDAAQCGFDAKACIHPAQVEVVRGAFAPSEDEVARARATLAAGRVRSGGAFELDGAMIDQPVLRQARRVIARAAVGVRQPADGP